MTLFERILDEQAQLRHRDILGRIARSSGRRSRVSETGDVFVSIAEAAAQMNVSEDEVRDLVLREVIECRESGGVVKVRPTIVSTFSLREVVA